MTQELRGETDYLAQEEAHRGADGSQESGEGIPGQGRPQQRPREGRSAVGLGNTVWTIWP